MQSNKPLSVIVLCVFILNLLLLTKVSGLETQLQNLENNYRNLRNEINSISGSVQNTLSRFTAEQSWITPVQVNEKKTHFENGQGFAVFSWQIKDWQEDAEVNFHYRLTESGEFQAIAAQNKGAGLFEVELPLEIEVEPYWSVGVSITSGLSTKTSEPAARAEAVTRATDAGTDQSFWFYVSMKTTEGTKSSEMGVLDVGYLAKTKYEPVDGRVRIKDNIYDVLIYNQLSAASAYNLTSAHARFYNGATLVAAAPLEAREETNGSMQPLELRYEPGKQAVTHLIIEVQYGDGKTFSKRIDV